MLPEQDVGYIEYEGQSPDIGNAVASYDSPAMMAPSGFDGTAAEPVMQESPSSPFQQASLRPDNEGEVVEAGCPDGKCGTGIGPRSPGGFQLGPGERLVPGSVRESSAPATQVAAAGQPAAAKPAGPDYSLTSNIPVTTIAIPSPVTGETVASIPVLQIEGLQRFTDTMMARANAAGQAQNWPMYMQNLTMAKAGLEQMRRSQDISVASATLITSLHAEREAYLASLPDANINAKVSVFSRPDLSAEDAAWEVTNNEFAEQNQAAGEKAVSDAPGWQQLYAANLSKARAVKMGILVTSLSAIDSSGMTPEQIAEAKEQSHTAQINQLRDFYAPVIDELGEAAYDKNVIYKAIRNEYGDEMISLFTKKFSDQGDSPEVALVKATSMASQWNSAWTNSLMQSYSESGAFKTVPQSETEIAKQAAAQAVDQTATFFESAYGAAAEAANRFVTQPIDNVYDYGASFFGGGEGE
jgi:hypothetical protein